MVGLMQNSASTRLKAIAFDHNIKRLIKDFTGREWVLEEINRCLQQENNHFFLLTGEPGVGKSAIAAHLIQTRKVIVAYHFCQAQDAQEMKPGRILRSLSSSKQP